MFICISFILHQKCTFLVQWKLKQNALIKTAPCLRSGLNSEGGCIEGALESPGEPWEGARMQRLEPGRTPCLESRVWGSSLNKSTYIRAALSSPPPLRLFQYSSCHEKWWLTKKAKTLSPTISFCQKSFLCLGTKLLRPARELMITVRFLNTLDRTISLVFSNSPPLTWYSYPTGWLLSVKYFVVLNILLKLSSRLKW